MTEQIIDSGLTLHNFESGTGWVQQPVFALFVYLSRPALVIGYLLWSVNLLLRYNREGRESAVPGKQQFKIKWIWVLLGFLFIFLLSHSLQMVISLEVRNITVFRTLNILQMISAIGLAGLLFSPFFFSDILYGLPRFSMTAIHHEYLAVVPEVKASKQKTASSKFETSYLDLIAHKTEMCMSEHHPNLQQDFNLTQLSVLINIPAHHPAYYFVKDEKSCFREYRDKWWIKYAKQLILQGKINEMSLKAIGLLSGFSSHMAFTFAFRKNERITPAGFAKLCNSRSG
ncbi:MAG: hypothetical protein EOM06_14700 [Sphingobacteriia bacterium]|nr:hypothetical protein [Sphingobacteriia bacterium]